MSSKLFTVVHHLTESMLPQLKGIGHTIHYLQWEIVRVVLKRSERRQKWINGLHTAFHSLFKSSTGTFIFFFNFICSTMRQELFGRLVKAIFNIDSWNEKNGYCKHAQGWAMENEEGHEDKGKQTFRWSIAVVELAPAAAADCNLLTLSWNWLI